jgi:ribonucleotide reductase alpha subunit
MWQEKDCLPYLKTAAVIAAWVDQSISTNTFYNPANYEGGKVPATIVAKNLMLGIHWGLKSYYYSLINKVGAKAGLKEDNVFPFIAPVEHEEEESCESCKL